MSSASHQLLLLLLTAVSVCRGQLGISPQDMQNAVNSLSRTFMGIRNEGLGVHLVEAGLRGARYSTDTLTDEKLNGLLVNTSLVASVNAVLTLFDQLATRAEAMPTLGSVPGCCDDTSSSFGCAYGTNARQDIQQALGLSPLPEGAVVMFGGTDGSIIQAPSPSPAPDNCVDMTPDSRLQRWFVEGSLGAAKPREVVLLVDFVTANGVSDANIATVRQAARLILSSLTDYDRVGMVALDSTPRVPNVIDRLTAGSDETIPVCSDTISSLDAFVTSYTPTAASTGSVSYRSAFMMALGLFSDMLDTEKILLYLTPGLTFSINNEIDLIKNDIVSFQNASFVIYRSFADVGGVFERNFSGAVFTLTTPLSNVLGSYYALPPDLARNDGVVIDHANPSGTVDGNSLTLRRSLYNTSNTLVGVAYAILPFHVLLRPLIAELSTRDHSYPFVLVGDHTPLFHPLFPGDSRKNVLITDLEPEGVITGLLNSDSTDAMPVMKQHIFYTGSTDSNAFVLRTLPSTLRCRGVAFQGGVDGLTVCVLLADEERTVRTLDHASVNIQALYTATRRAPIYHDVRNRVDSNLQLCNYFCKQSITSRVSFQLTTPSSPPADYEPSLVSQLTEYIEGRGNTPSFVEEGVAEEAAVLLSGGVASVWLNMSAKPSDYIARRHLATPRGLYLTYPPSHLQAGFQPTLAEWYRAPLARPSLITVAPPREDPLREGGMYTVAVGYALRTPTSQSDEGSFPVGVVSADITLESLRVFVRQALPACEEEDGMECIIVDDSGNLVYERDLERFGGEARFFGHRDERLRNVVGNLSSLATKRQCIELFNGQLASRRFYTLDTSNQELVQNPPGHCADFMVQHIPSTNLFLVAVESDDGCFGKIICNCDDNCFNCRGFNVDACECPCTCSDGCQETTGFAVCPAVIPQATGYDRVVEEQISHTAPPEQFCFDQECSCRKDFDSCFGVRECHWCEREQKCAQLTECCSLDEGRSCCTSSQEERRLAIYGETCLVFATQCFNHPVLNETCPRNVPPSSSSPTSAIVGGVVGGLIGVVLIAIIVTLIIYYQVCRKVDPAEESSRESAFDFSNKTAIGNSVGAKAKKSKGSSKSNSEVDAEKVADKEATPPKEKDEEKPEKDTTL